MILKDMSTIVRFSGIFMNRSLADKNISSTENYILMYLFGKDTVSQDEIVEYYAIDKGSISKTIRSLEQKGYIERYPNPENRRENIIKLSTLGLETFSESRSSLDEWHTMMMDGITIEEFKKVSKIISKMAENARKAIEVSDK